MAVLIAHYDKPLDWAKELKARDGFTRLMRPIGLLVVSLNTHGIIFSPEILLSKI